MSDVSIRKGEMRFKSEEEHRVTFQIFCMAIRLRVKTLLYGVYCVSICFLRLCDRDDFTLCNKEILLGRPISTHAPTVTRGSSPWTPEMRKK